MQSPRLRHNKYIVLVSTILVFKMGLLRVSAAKDIVVQKQCHALPLQARGIHDRADQARLVNIATEEKVAPSDAERPDLAGSSLPGVETVWALNTPDKELEAKSAIQQVSERLLELAALLGAQQGSTRDSAGKWYPYTI